MGFGDLFRWKKKEENFDPLRDLTLSRLKAGYLLDYDMKTWEVRAYNKYEWDGEYTEEWELKSGSETMFLEKEEDDGDADWSLSWKVSISKIDKSVAERIARDEDPPDEIVFEGEKYFMSESGAGYFLKGGTGLGEGFISWEYEDESGEKLLTIHQWGDNDFELSRGIYAEEYQFTNILPGGESR